MDNISNNEYKEKPMRNLLRVLIVITFFSIIFYYTVGSDDQIEPLKSSNSAHKPIPKTTIEESNSMYLPRPTTGVSKYIGKKADSVVEAYGIPTRIEPSGFGYDWWIYVKESEYQMYGVRDNVVKQVYTNSNKIDVAPFKIDQTLEDIYRIAILESEITVEVDDNIYIFMMNENDMKSRIIVPYEGVFAQLYIDQDTESLSGIRFIDKDILLLHQPYEYQYVGEMLPKNTVSSFLQKSIDKSYANQVYDLVNEVRTKNNTQKLMKSPNLTDIATLRSESIYIQSVLPSEQSETHSLKEILEDKMVDYKTFEENLAINYYDAIEAYHGWLNSEAHRKILLSDHFNLTGTGVYMGHYSQVFVEKDLEGKVKK